MDDHAAVINLSRYHPAAGRRDELLGAMRAIAAQLSSVQGCFGAQACVSDVDPEVLVAVSRWASAEALRAQTGSQAFQAELDRLRVLLDRPAAHENLTPQ